MNTISTNPGPSRMDIYVLENELESYSSRLKLARSVKRRERYCKKIRTITTRIAALKLSL